MHGLNIIKRLNQQEEARVQQALRQAERERTTQPQLSQTLAEYYAAKGHQYAQAGF